jgi:hypothetical protein
MTKTPEELAEEFAEFFAGERRKTIAKKSWWTGYLAAAPQWISVKDRLPEDASDVLIVWVDGVSIACYDDGWNKIGTMLRSVTHWMPLPNPPEEV